MKKLAFVLMMVLFVSLLGSLVFTGAARAATYTPLTLPALTTDIRTWSQGYNYNGLFSGPGTTTTWTWNGVPFGLAEDSSGNTAYYNPGGSVTIPVGVYGVTNAYTLINTAYGSYGATVGTVEFLGSAGGDYVVNLVEGTNVRDHYNDGWQNIISGPTVVNAFTSPDGMDRLDMQIYNLPSSFSTQSLISIVFTNYGLGGDGQPFMAAATVATSPVPLPPALLLFGPGFAGIAAIRRRFKRFKK
jgi:hypothetical protein